MAVVPTLVFSSKYLVSVLDSTVLELDECFTGGDVLGHLFSQVEERELFDFTGVELEFESL